MKRNKKELDVDFIGGEGSLTKDEEKAISDFIKFRKRKTGIKKRSKTDKSTISGSKPNIKNKDNYKSYG